MGPFPWGFICGMLTVPVLVALLAFLGWAFGKYSGTGDCVTECAGSKDLEIGEHFNITVWLFSTYHRLFWSTRPAHKAAVTKYWQDIHDAGGQSRTDVGVVFND